MLVTEWCKITYIYYGDCQKMIHLEVETPCLSNLKEPNIFGND